MPRRSNSLSALLGASVVVLALLVSSAVQGGGVERVFVTGVGGSVKLVGTPRASEIVNFDSGSLGDLDGDVGLQPDESVSVFTVPTDRTLVVTAWHSSGTAGNFVLYEDVGGVLTVRACTKRFGNPALPLTFAPGSSVTCFNRGPLSGSVIVNFSGYLEGA